MTFRASRIRCEISLHLLVPDGKLVAEGDRLGMDAVGTADHNRILKFESAPFEDCQESIDIGDNEIRGLDEEKGE